MLVLGLITALMGDNDAGFGGACSPRGRCGLWGTNDDHLHDHAEGERDKEDRVSRKIHGRGGEGELSEGANVDHRAYKVLMSTSHPCSFGPEEEDTTTHLIRCG